jgi:hypothetical protein
MAGRSNGARGFSVATVYDSASWALKNPPSGPLVSG